jgi:hypothetical protein
MGKIIALLLLCAGCATTAERKPEPAPTAAPPPETTAPAASAPTPELPPGLTFNVQPPEAELWVDGESHGKIQALGPSHNLALKPGIYRVSLKCPGYDTWRAEVAVKDKPELIQVSLARAP